MPGIARSTLDRLILLCWALLLGTLSAPLLLDDNASIGFWLMQCLPWLLLLPGLLHGNPRSLQWLGFLVLFFFTVGILQVFSSVPTDRLLGLATILLCAILFAAAIVSLRHRRRRSTHSGESPHGRTQ